MSKFHKINEDSTAANEIANCFMVAAEQFRQHAATFRSLIDYKPAPDALMAIHGPAARAMAEQFEAQANEASFYCQVFQSLEEPVIIQYDEERVEEDDE